MVKIAILGCGNIGFFLAAKILHHYHPLLNNEKNVNKNVELLLVGRQRLLSDLNISGKILLTAYDGLKTIISKDHVNYVTDVKKLIEFQPDYVLVTLKVTQTVEVMKEITELDGKITIVSIQNGVRNLDLISKNFHKSIVIGGMIVQNITYSKPCNFTQTSNGTLVLQSTPSTHSIYSILSNAGINITISNNIKNDQYGKLLLNLLNAFSALAGSFKNVLESKTYRRMLATCQWEALEVLEYSEINYKSFNKKMPMWFMPYVLYSSDWACNFFIRKVAGMNVNNSKSSMVEDFILGRKTEIDEFQGEIVRLGEIIRKDMDEGAIIMDGVKVGESEHYLTPYNFGILELIKLIEEWMEEHNEGWKVKLPADEVLAFIEDGIVPQALQS